MRRLFLIILFVIFTGIGAASFFYKNKTEPIALQNNTQNKNYWQPAPDYYRKWHIQYSGDLDIWADADIFNVDLFDTSKEDIALLRKRGKKVICYFNAGAWEDWRQDKNDFPLKILGNDYAGWPGEKWLDIRSEALRPIIAKWLDIAKDKKCDAVDPDNVDGYDTDTGFPLTYNNQLIFNKWLAESAHSRGLSIGLKNNQGQASDLIDYFDWALLENCDIQDWCSEMKIFTDHNKAVFQIEYVENGAALEKFCPAAQKNKFSAVLKNLKLDAWRQTCP